MSGYSLTWVTDKLAIGHAPMSYADLDYIRAQGVDAIINLCGEYCDLHEIEEGAGFDVYYLPIEDENAPEQSDLETALDWLNRSTAEGKRVLVHCRFGKGRTGTVVTSYLLHQGYNLKEAERKMKGCHCLPTSFSQWRFIKKLNKRLKAK